MRGALVAVLTASVALTGGCVMSRASRPIAMLPPAPSLIGVRVDTVRELVAVFPPAISRLYLAPSNDPFGVALAADLRRAGYAIVEGVGTADAEPGYNLRYALARLDDGLVAVTLRVGATTLSRVYSVRSADASAESAWSIDLTHATPDLRERVELLASAPPIVDTADAPPVAVAASNDAGSAAWVARLRAGPVAPAAVTSAQVEKLAVPAASAAADLPPLPPRLSQGASAPVIAAVAPVAVAKAAPGPWRVQLGAYDAPRDAQLYARDLLRRHSAVLSSALPFFVRVGSRLPRTVVQVGPYATRADAVSVCLGLRATRADCIVARG